MVRGRTGLVALGVPLLLGVVACGGDASSTAPLAPGASSTPAGMSTPDGAASVRGQELARTRGCSACHGADGQGGLGPAWTGLLGRTVPLADGSTVVADQAYVTEAITDPSAKVVDGFAVAMPKADLSDAEVTDLVAYIASLGR